MCFENTHLNVNPLTFEKYYIVYMNFLTMYFCTYLDRIIKSSSSSSFPLALSGNILISVFVDI